jgi:histidinol-phosphatase (PHP family)
VLTDYHLHLQPDGPEARAADGHRWEAAGGPRSVAWITRYVEAARARAVEEIAITEHVHRFREVADWHPNAWWRAEATEDLAEHCAAIGRARDDAGLPVLLGIEMDWIPGREDDIRALLASQPFDIVLGSVHWLGDLAVDHPDYPCWDALGAEETWGRYLDELGEAAASGLFDVLAHPDLPKVFGTAMPAAVGARRDEAIARIAESGVAVECSSAGLRKPCRALYPDPDWLAAFRRAGVPVTLASDAHRPEDVARDYPTAVAALRGAGYETITRFRGREPEQVAIRWA